MRGPLVSCLGNHLSPSVRPLVGSAKNICLPFLPTQHDDTAAHRRERGGGHRGHPWRGTAGAGDKAKGGFPGPPACVSRQAAAVAAGTAATAEAGRWGWSSLLAESYARIWHLRCLHGRIHPSSRRINTRGLRREHTQKNCSGQAHARERDEAGGTLVFTCGDGGPKVLEAEAADDAALLGDGEVLLQVCRLLTGGRYTKKVVVPAGQLLPVPRASPLGTRSTCLRWPAPSGPPCS